MNINMYDHKIIVVVLMSIFTLILPVLLLFAFFTLIIFGLLSLMGISKSFFSFLSFIYFTLLWLWKETWIEIFTDELPGKYPRKIIYGPLYLVKK